MGLSATLEFCGLFLGLGVFCGWRGARPFDPRRGPRLIPYRFLMVLCGALLLYLTAHLVNLMGVTTGAR